jgi:hypothetical protein
VGNLTGKMIFSCRDCTTAIDMSATSTDKGLASFEVDSRAMCEDCAARLAQLGFGGYADSNGLSHVVCPHIAEDLAQQEDREHARPV